MKLKEITAGLLLASLGAGLALGAQTTPQPTARPFLWRIEGPVPSYLYGTIHVPDRRVVALPDVVRRAIDVSDALYTELPLDAATQLSITPRLMLPAGQDLRTVAGEELFGRVMGLIAKAFGDRLPPGATDVLAMTISRLKPIMAVTQLLQLDFLPDVLAGRKTLDAMIYDMAVQSGKEVGGLETVDEQLAVLDSLTLEEQVEVLKSAVDSIENPAPGDTNVQKLIDLYLSGDLEALTTELNKQDPEIEVLQKKFKTNLLDDRNVKMAGRIAGRVAERPARTYFFAVGAAHYQGETGILALLAQKGLKVTRLGAADAPSVVKPAA